MSNSLILSEARRPFRKVAKRTIASTEPVYFRENFCMDFKRMDFKRIKWRVFMLCILSFQFLLNFGNSCNCRKLSSNFRGTVTAARFCAM